jgi:hypothetical protein
MHNLLYSGVLVSIILLLTQCHDADEDVFSLKGVTTKVVGETIVIENNHGSAISYFAAETETLKAIRWIPVSNADNTIANGSTKVIPWDDIASVEALQKGDEVIIHWWLAQDSTVTSSEINRNFLTL